MSIVRKTLALIRREGGGRVDPARVKAWSEADIEKMAEADETPGPTDADLADARVVRPYTDPEQV